MGKKKPDILTACTAAVVLVGIAACGPTLDGRHMVWASKEDPEHSGKQISYLAETGVEGTELGAERLHDGYYEARAEGDLFEEELMFGTRIQSLEMTPEAAEQFRALAAKLGPPQKSYWLKFIGRTAFGDRKYGPNNEIDLLYVMTRPLEVRPFQVVVPPKAAPQPAAPQHN